MDAIDTGRFTGDQTGMGQGLAYVLPQSRSVGYFMQLANEKAQQRRDDAAELKAKQQKVNEEYANHVYQTKTPEIANEYTKWLQPKFDDLLGQMADYHTKTNQDPYTNPFFVKQFNDLSTVAKNTHEANLTHTAYAAQIADRSKNYTPESKQAGIDWLNAYHNDPVGNLYTPPPPLQERNLDLNDAVKLGHANANVRSEGGYTITEPNSHNHVIQAQAILSQPEFAPLLQQNGINPTVGDAFGQPNGHGGTIYPTDTPTVNAIADHIIQNAAQPHFAATLQAANIDPNDPHAKDKLTELVQRQNAGYGKVLGQFRDRLDANVETKKVPDYGEERLGISEANLELARQRLADMEAKQAEKSGPTYVQTLAEKSRNDILSQFQNGPKEISNPFPELDKLYKNNPNYLNGVKPVVEPNGNIKVIVPAQYKYDSKSADPNIPNSGRIPVKDAYSVTFDPNKPDEFKSLYGQLFDQATGEKAGQPSKINTPGGKGHMTGNPAQPAQSQQYTIKGKGYSTDQVSKAAAASGMSVDEYVKAVNNQ